MTEFTFYRGNGLFTGFELRGHCTADENDIEGRLVCAAVSSAAQLTANTLSEVLGCGLSEEFANENDAEMRICLKNPQKNASEIIDGLRFHIKELTRQFPSRLSFIIKEA